MNLVKVELRYRSPDKSSPVELKLGALFDNPLPTDVIRFHIEYEDGSDAGSETYGTKVPVLVITSEP